MLGNVIAAYILGGGYKSDTGAATWKGMVVLCGALVAAVLLSRLPWVAAASGCSAATLVLLAFACNVSEGTRLNTGLAIGVALAFGATIVLTAGTIVRSLHLFA